MAATGNVATLLVGVDVDDAVDPVANRVEQVGQGDALGPGAPDRGAAARRQGAKFMVEARQGGGFPGAESAAVRCSRSKCPRAERRGRRLAGSGSSARAHSWLGSSWFAA